MREHAPFVAVPVNVPPKVAQLLALTPDGTGTIPFRAFASGTFEIDVLDNGSRIASYATKKNVLSRRIGPPKVAPN